MPHDEENSDKKPMDVVIVGGSLAGLMAGILLKRKGHNVRILEQASSSERSGLAAGVGLPQHVQSFFNREDRLKDDPFWILNSGFEVVDSNLETKMKLSISVNLTTWDAAYYRLRANFDGYTSSYCQQPPSINADGTEGNGVYDTGKKVLKVEEGKDSVRLTVKDTNTGATEEIESEIVIAADGANSSIRRQLHPDLQREEPGYVIWRGTISTKDLSEDVLARIENKPVIWPGPQTYCIIYTIPGENGSLAQGERHINFAWYFWPRNASLTDIMTDSDGHLHRTTIPKGKIRPEIWQPQLELARQLLPKELSALVERIREPFVSVISSISAPQAAYFNNRLFLVGDALCQTQPNMGMGTNLAAFAVMSLVDEVLCPPRLSPEAVTAWENKILQETSIVRYRSVAFASWYLNSWPKIGWYFARYYGILYWQYWFGKRAEKFVVYNNRS